ncbi:MAG TPA: cob(I)yrinic acid a,c-diamide adenosyltransferase [Dermatophilaceae bacterium]|jgi:ATP:cob(I)alamin adenosyltransferase
MPAVYTRTGDAGDTALYGGTRLAKASNRVEAYGSLDEANTSIGFARAELPEGWMADRLKAIQVRLFTVGAEVASDDQGRARLTDTVTDEDVTGLERLIDECLAIAGAPRAFAVPGRDVASGALHVARTAVRRAERRLLVLPQSGSDSIRPVLVRYINRLSDALYGLARVAEFRHDELRVEKIVRQVVAAALGQPASQGGGPDAKPRALSLETAKAMSAAAEESATRLGVPIVFAAVDAGGNLVLLHRMADSLLGSLDLAVGKAYTSAAFRVSTDNLRPQALPDGPLFGIEASNAGRIVLFGGGEPLFTARSLAGGIGVSGGTVEQDIVIVKDALRAGWE